MARSFVPVLLVALAAPAALVVACAQEVRPTRPSEALDESPAAVAAFDALALRFSWPAVPPRPSSRPVRPGRADARTASLKPRAVLAPITAAFRRSGDTFETHLSPMGFSAHANGALALRDPNSNVTAEVRLVGARPTLGEIARGHVVYPNAAPGGGDLVVTPLPGGAEDWIALPSAHAVSSLDYVVTLGNEAAGLRLVDGTLEILDRRGIPRLRMARPQVVSGDGRVLPAHTRIEGCAFDTSPIAPFGRAVTPPRAANCGIHVGWDGEGLTYPALVDPAWSTTMQLAAPRHGHVATRLANGSVLVAGGQTTNPVTTSVEVATAEVWSQGAWATTGSLAMSRDAAATATLSNGDILVSGGLTNQGMDVLGSAEIYSPQTGLWRGTGQLAVPRAGHTATEIGDGTVLVSAGYDNSGDHFTEAELFDGSAFRPAGKINQTRYFHTAVALGGGRVLVGGGTDPMSGALGSVELYTAGIGWSTAASLAPMRTPRTLHASATLPNGEVLFAGGFNPADGAVAGAERYSPATNTWTNDATMARGRYDSAPATMPDGRVLVVSGQSLTWQYSDGELYDPLARTFVRTRGASTARTYGHTATALLDGRVLAVGGRNPGPILVAAADLFDTTQPDVDAGADDEPDATADAAVPQDAAWPPSPGEDSGATDASRAPDDARPPWDSGSPPSAPAASNPESYAPIPVLGGGCNTGGQSGHGAWVLAAAGWMVAKRRGAGKQKR